MASEQLGFNPSMLSVGALAAAFAYGAAHFYQAQWRRLRSDRTTPTGFGGVLAFFVAAGVAFGSAPTGLVAATAVIALGTAIYWIDDLIGLSVRSRLAIQFCVGAAIAALVLQSNFTSYSTPLAGLCLLGGIANVCLTNIVNFYDGADLNLGTFIILTAAAILVFAANDPVLSSVSVFLFAFIIPFAWINRVPHSLYLGDAGSFTFACVLTMLAALYLRDNGAMHPLVFAPAALPALDTAFVFALRLVRGENVLSRNWQHLYQRLQIERGSFVYLLPQVVNFGLVIVGALALEAIGLHRLWASLTAAALATPIYYFASRGLMLKEWWPND